MILVRTCRRGLERLLRKLMRMPGQPGIVYVHYWAGLMMRRFIDTAEDAIDIVLKVPGNSIPPSTSPCSLIVCRLKLL